MKVFTTSQVAKICKVATRTVMQWVDSGEIEGCYRLPNSAHRRIPKAGLVAFLAANGMPTIADLEEVTVAPEDDVWVWDADKRCAKQCIVESVDRYGDVTLLFHGVSAGHWRRGTYHLTRKAAEEEP